MCQSDSLGACLSQHRGQPWPRGGIAAAKCLQNDALGSATQQHGAQGGLSHAGGEGCDGHVGVERSASAFVEVWLPQALAVKHEFDSASAQFRVVGAVKRVELARGMLVYSVSAKEAVLKKHRHLAHMRATLGVAQHGDFEAREQVVAAVAAKHAERNLASRQHHRLAK